MREILFRGKRLDNRKWIEGAYVFCRGHHYILPYDFANEKGFDERYSDWFEVDPSTVGEYAGRKDKNCVKIFEDDVVKYVIEEGCEYTKTVVFKDGAFNLKQELNYCANYWYSRGQLDFEVIGNIHDNPELLEGRSYDM